MGRRRHPRHMVQMMFRKLGLALVVLISGCLWAQNPQPQNQASEDEKLQSESNPTQSVFLSIRNEYFNLADGNWVNALIVRSDKVFFKKNRRLGGKAGILTRFDFPIATAQVGGATQAGLGDLYTQFVYVPWLTPRFALAMGSGFTLPTATHSTLGSGKWQAAPVVAPVWFFPERKGYFLVKLQNFVSFAGAGSRPDVNYLLTTPTVFYRFHRRWWVLLDTEAKTNWERDHRVSFRSGIQVGHAVSPRIALFVKNEAPWGEHREGDWALKVGMIVYREK